MTFVRVGSLTLFLAFLFASTSAIAKPVLINFKGGKASANLAKSWTKVKDGQYDFELDTSKKLKGGKPLTVDAVKTTLEKKMKKFKVSVAKKSASAVSVSYSGDEQKFLKKLSKVKIRSGAKVDLALESSVSEGGIRAKTAERNPVDGEIKGTVIKVSKKFLTLRVNASKVDGVKAGTKVKVAHGAFKAKKKQKLFFMPNGQKGGVWAVKSGSLKTE